MYGAKMNQEEYPEKDLISFYEDQAVVTDTIMDYKQRRSSQHRRSMLCFNISVLFQLVILVVTTGFCLWLYTQYQTLRAELEKLKNDSANLSQAASAEARFAVSHCNHSAAILDYHSSLESMKNSHHGIANSEIAHIYGDEEVLRSYKYNVPPDGYDRLEFNRQTRFPECDNCIVYMNSNDDVWYSLLNRFAVGLSSGQENFYRYFKQADWMDDPLSNYIVNENCKIQVKTDGMYQIHAHIQFIMLQGINTEASMRVMKFRNGRNSSTLGACYVSAARLERHRWMRQYHCSVYQVSMLKESDEIYIDIEAYSVFSIHPDQLHLTVIKLNSGGGNHTHPEVAGAQ